MNPVVKPSALVVSPAVAGSAQVSASGQVSASAHMASQNDQFLLRQPTREEAEAAVRTLILWAGDDPSREGLLDTPRRVEKSMRFLTSGSHKFGRRSSWET